MGGSVDTGPRPAGLLRRFLGDNKNGDDRRTADDATISLADDAPVGLFLCDQAGRILAANNTLAGWLGRAESELRDGRVTLAEILETPFQPLTAGQDQATGIHMLVGPDGGAGRRVHIAQRRRASATPGGADIHGAVVDLSGEPDATEKLAQFEHRFDVFFDHAPVGIAWVTPEGEVGECNKAFGRLVQAETSTGTGLPLLSIVAEKDREAVAASLARLADGSEQRATIEVHLAADSESAVELHLRRDGGAPGRPRGIVVHALDATERKNLEAQFAQSQKMQAVGQLAGGIAHDFNNLLTAMIGFCDLLLLRHRPGEESFADIMQIKQNANRAANLVRQLLAFSRQQTLAPKVLNITDVVAELSYLLRRLIGENIELEINHGRDLGLVRVDQSQLEQVIINLAVNARDAMLDGGTLTIRTRNVVIDDPVRRGADILPPGTYALIEVIDTGTGIAEENMERIFEPFFSTKEIGAGTGLGLSTVYGIVRQTGGFVFVDNGPDKGARFSIFLPIHEPGEGDAPPPPVEVVDDIARDLTGHGTVLLVEDEDAVRVFGARALRNKGYTVLEAESGEAALEVLAQHGGDIDLLISDVVMPNMDGPTLMREVHKDRPDLKVIFISGYAEDAFRKNLDPASEFELLPKPFSLKQLASKVKDMLGTWGRALAGRPEPAVPGRPMGMDSPLLRASG